MTLTDLIIDIGIDISEFSKEEINQLLEMWVDSQEVELETMNAPKTHNKHRREKGVTH